MKYHEIKNFAGRLRKNPTQSEKVLWELLRGRRLGGYKFLRQHPLYYEHVNNEHFIFIPDFYCAELRLIIELDGKIHLFNIDKDENRDEILRNKGFQILRILNEELNQKERLKNKILNFIISINDRH